MYYLFCDPNNEHFNIVPIYMHTYEPTVHPVHNSIKNNYYLTSYPINCRHFSLLKCYNC